MAINLGKAMDDLTEKEPLEEGYYLARIVKVRENEPNRAMKDGGEHADGAGRNIVLDLKLVSEDPLVNGRFFRKYLVLPRPGDENLPGFQYNTMEDQRIADILEVAAAFKGCAIEDLDPSNLEFEIGSRAMVFIQPAIDNRTGKPTDEISMSMPIRPEE